MLKLINKLSKIQFAFSNEKPSYYKFEVGCSNKPHPTKELYGGDD